MTERPESNANRRRLLAVDDSRLILRVIEDFFVDNGWHVTTAESVAKARAALAVADPDVIVSDILMPDVDGWAFFEDVRRRKETASVPFVFLTVERELPKRLRGLHLGADDYMTKPFAVEELHVRIERLLERRAALKRAGEAGNAALLAGTTDHLALSDLLQILALNGKDGTVRLLRGGDAGRIELSGGDIVDAQAGFVRGTKALFRMLSWADAGFRVIPRDGEAPERTIEADTANLLMDGMVSLDEWARWKPQLPAAGTRLDLSHEARGRLSGHPVLPAELELLAKAKAGTTVALAIEQIPRPDAEVAEAICALLARGVLIASLEDVEAPPKSH
jgi:DNA-binding response OmpR family regulator